MLCSRAEFKANQELVPITKRETTGDSSETAILRFLELSINDVNSFRARYPKVCEIPFSMQDRIRVSRKSNHLLYSLAFLPTSTEQYFSDYF